MEEDQLLFVSCDIQSNQKEILAPSNFKSILSDAPELNSINLKFFSSDSPNLLKSFFIILLSLSVSILAVLPYTVYPRQLLVGDWTLFCIIRPIVFSIVFFSSWHKLLSRENNHWGTWRIIINCLFAGVYTGLYAIKWAETNGIYIKYLSIPCFSLSWFVVFYEVMDRHLSSGSSSGSIDLRRKKTLLYMIREQEKNSWSRPEYTNFIFKSLRDDKNISVLACKHQDALLLPTSDEEAKLGVYEASSFDSWQEKISAGVNLLVGFSFIPLILAIIEDYGYSLYRLVSNEGVFLWLVFILCSILSALYLLATYPIYQKMFSAILGLIRDTRETIFSFGRRTPLYFFSVVMSMSRANASYSIFGSIAGRMSVPEGMGLLLVWFFVLVVGLVDYSATLKILSRTVKYSWMTLLMSAPEVECLEKMIEYSTVRYHSKRLKRLVRNSDDYELSCLSGCLL